MSENIKHTKKALEWRRSFVLSKLSVGWTQQEIAAALHLHPSTISLDVQFLREEARNNLRYHLQEKLPFEHLRAVTGINGLVKKANDILDDTKDRRLQLQTINTLANLYAGIITMTSDANIIQQAMERVEQLEDIKRGKYEYENPLPEPEPESKSKSEEKDDEEPTPTEPEEEIDQED
jgi:hypothetical protein